MQGRRTQGRLGRSEDSWVRTTLPEEKDPRSYRGIWIKKTCRNSNLDCGLNCLKLGLVPYFELTPDIPHFNFPPIHHFHSVTINPCWYQSCIVYLLLIQLTKVYKLKHPALGCHLYTQEWWQNSLWCSVHVPLPHRASIAKPCTWASICCTTCATKVCYSLFNVTLRYISSWFVQSNLWHLGNGNLTTSLSNFPPLGLSSLVK